MQGIRREIERKLKAPFIGDVDLGPHLVAVDWRIIRRIFFQFVDELPYLSTSKENAFYSGIGYYSCIDLAVLSSLFLILGIITSKTMAYVPLSARLLLCTFVLAVMFGVLGAKAAIRKHKSTSMTQLDAILAEKRTELKQRFLNALSAL